MPTALEYALQFTQKGWYVFPIVPYRKIPFKDFHWKDLSTKDPDQIKAAANYGRYKNCNWAIDCGKSNITVLDLDIRTTGSKSSEQGHHKPPRDGRKDLETLGISFDELLNSTYCIQTPSGGFHFYFYGSRPSDPKSLGLGLEVRSIGNYALIPGSGWDATGNHVYKEKKPLNQYPVLGLFPKILSNHLKNKDQSKQPNRDIPITDLDQDNNIQLAIQYLTSNPPKAIEYQGGNNTTYAISCKLRDYGLSDSKTLELLLEHWNDKHAIPPWTTTDLEKIVKAAYDYAKDRPGNASIEAVFPDNTDLIIPKINGIRCARNINPLKILPRPWILGRRYLPGYVTVTIAPGGVGKSLFTILEGLAIASNQQLTYDSVYNPGSVWVYNAEDPFDELERRIAATAIHYNLTAEDLKNFYYTSGYDLPLKLSAYDQKQRPIANIKLIDNLIQYIGDMQIRLFILDPFIRCHSLKENDNEGADFTMQQFQRIASKTNCAISIVHHTKKRTPSADGYGDMDMSRGASSLIYAARIAHTLYPMGEKECKLYGVQPLDRDKYIRMDGAKANLSLLTGKELWYRKQSVAINKEDTETTGVLERAEGLIPTLIDQQDRLILDMIAHHVGPEEPKSMTAIAKILEASEFISIKQRQLINKIPQLFQLPYYKDGYTWRKIYGKNKTGKETVYIECTKEIEGADTDEG